MKPEETIGRLCQIKGQDSTHLVDVCEGKVKNGDIGEVVSARHNRVLKVAFEDAGECPVSMDMLRFFKGL